MGGVRAGDGLGRRRAPETTKQLVAVAVAPSPSAYCIHSHTRVAVREGATEREIVDAIWVAAEMRAGGAYAKSVIALDAAGSGPDGR